MKPVFQFQDGAHLRGDAQVVGERLEAIRAKKGTLTPDLVLGDAKNIRSPLHEYFEWDDSKAAHQHRVEQARYLIRSVTVVYEAGEPAPARQAHIETVPLAPTAPPRPVRAFVSVQRDDGGRGYESTAVAMNDADMRRQVLERAHGEMAAVGRRYRELQELSEVFKALDQVDQLLHSGARQAA